MFRPTSRSFIALGLALFFRRPACAQLLSPNMMRSCDLNKVFGMARARAKDLIKEPGLQKVEFSGVNGAGAAGFSFYSPDFTQCLHVRITCAGEKLWEMSDDHRDSDKKMPLLKDISGLKVTPTSAFEKAFRYLPGAHFNRGGLQIKEDGTLQYYFIHSTDWQSEPRAFIDGRTGLLEIWSWEPLDQKFVLERVVE